MYLAPPVFPYPKIGSPVREHANGKKNSDSTRSNSIHIRTRGNRLSASYRRRKFHPANYLHSNDRSPWSYQLDSALTRSSYRITIAAASLSATGVGIWQLIWKLMGH